MTEPNPSRPQPENPLEEAARLMSDFQENLIDGKNLVSEAIRLDKTQAPALLVDSFYLQTICKGIKAVYLQQEEILKRLTEHEKILKRVPPYEGGHHA